MCTIPKYDNTTIRNNATSCDIYSSNKKLFDRNKKEMDSSYTTDGLVIQQESRVFSFKI